MLSYENNFLLNSCDTPRPWGLYFQDNATPQMEGLVELHDNIMFYLVIILFGVGWIMMVIIKDYIYYKSPISYKYLNHGTLIELIWTITPALILILIAFPSFKLLYLTDEVSDASMCILSEGFFFGGLILYILNKIKDTFYGKGEKNTTLISNFTQIRNSNPRIGLAYKNNKLNYYRCFHTKVKASNRIGPHNNDVISLIIGSLLGDAYGNRRSGEGTRFCYRQSIVHKDYLFWLYNFFYTRGYCSNLEPRKYTRVLNDKNVKEHFGYEFNTFIFRSFDWIYNMFYRKGKKRISSNIINYFTPLTLAVWIMDDGGFVKPSVRISTYNFTLTEVEHLVNILKELYGLNCTIQTLKNKNQYAIYILKESVPKLTEIVLPYIHSSMHYKLGIKN
jgi:heme/copper-type cytochrome/quinol oxidase subunit 2